MVAGGRAGGAGDRGGMAEGGHATNGLCEHVACCAQPYCFIPELERIIANYLPREKFQKKAREGRGKEGKERKGVVREWVRMGEEGLSRG